MATPFKYRNPGLIDWAILGAVAAGGATAYLWACLCRLARR
jgi:hypothetical protein